MRRGSIFLILGVLSISALACCRVSEDPLEANRELIRRFGGMANAADWGGLREVVADDFVRHSQATSGVQVKSCDEFIELQKSFYASMPDQHIALEMMVAEGDKVAALATYSGTQTGPMGDFPITNKKAEMPVLAIFRIEEGMIAELWVEWDNLAMLSQLGLFPPPPPAAEEEVQEVE